MMLTFVGGDSHTLAPLELVSGPLGTETKVTEVAATIANDRLASGGFAPLTAAATALANRKPKTINGVTFRFAKIQTHAGGDNMPPTHRYAVLALSEGKTLHVFDDEGEGLTATPSVRVLDHSRLLVETKLDVGREGEFRHNVDVAVIDLATGKVMR